MCDGACLFASEAYYFAGIIGGGRAVYTPRRHHGRKSATGVWGEAVSSPTRVSRSKSNSGSTTSFSDSVFPAGLACILSTSQIANGIFAVFKRIDISGLRRRKRGRTNGLMRGSELAIRELECAGKGSSGNSVKRKQRMRRTGLGAEYQCHVVVLPR